MNCARAIAILDSMLKGQLAATPEELQELIKQQLVVAVDPWLMANLRTLADLCEAHRAEVACFPEEYWSPNWLQAVLSELETKLRSDFHRAITSKQKLAQEEAERASMRRCLGLLRDPEVRAQAQEASRVLTEVVAPNIRPVPLPPEPAPVYAVTRLGVEVGVQGQPRLARYGEANISELVKSVRKADAKTQQLLQQVAAVDSGLGYVRKGRHQVVAGLMKSGLNPDQAVSAYRQAQQRMVMGRHPAEPPHLAVTLVRHAMDTHDVAAAEQRMLAAEAVLVRRGVPAGTQARGAAKSLLGFPDLEGAASRFLHLCSFLRHREGDHPDLLRWASRLMPVKAKPKELADLCAHAARMLQRAGYPNHGRIDAIAVALASMAVSQDKLAPLVERYSKIAQLVTQEPMGRATALNGSVELTACPGTPEEVVMTARTLAGQLGNGRSRDEAFELACSLARRVVF